MNDEVESGFLRGMRRGADPGNVHVSGGHAITTLDSEWWYEECAVCGHTFRDNDPVLLDVAADGTMASVRHSGGLLSCAADPATSAPPDPLVAEAFFRGMRAAEQEDEEHPGRGRAGEPPAVRIRPDHPLVHPPGPGGRRRRCLCCDHTIRPDEAVVICPCSPGDRGCQEVIHHDMARGLACYDLRYPRGVTRCEAMLGKVEHRPAAVSRMDELAGRARVAANPSQVVVVRGTLPGEGGAR